MAIIQSDSFEIGKALKELVHLCETSGAQFHPDLTIQYQNFNLKVVCKEKNNERLVSLSEESLISVKSQDFYLKNDNIVLMTNADTGWSNLQSDIAHVMFSIINAGEKITQIKGNSFWLTMQSNKELCRHLSLAKGFTPSDKRFLNDSQTQLQQDQVVIENFFNSRVLALSKENTENQRVIMPVIDYFNHHWAGSSFNIQPKNSANFLSIGCAQPMPSSNECFAFYSTMDALDSYIKYGFADLASPVVRSVPLDIILDNVGRIEILGVIAKPVPHKSLQTLKNIPRQVPMVAETIKGSHIKISHIFIPGESTPYAMKRVLAALIRRLSSKVFDNIELKKLITICEEQIISANITYYKKLKILADSPMLEEIAASQLNKIDCYVRKSM